jgi:methionyl-tRNA formyltransferase
MQQLRDWAPELIVVAAFGQILRPEVLDLPRYGCVNVHGSLLPRWRGAAPIQAAILHGDRETGITIMRMDPGIDTGPVLSQAALPILAEDTAGTMIPRMAELGSTLLIETLPGYLSGAIQPQLQDESQATYAPMLKKEDGLLDFARTAAELVNRVRAFNPWPGAYMLWQGEPLKIHRAAIFQAGDTPHPVGQAAIAHGLPAVVTSNGWLVLLEIQPAGKKPMPGKVFLQGARGWGV